MTSIASRGLTLSYQRQVIIDALDMQLPKGKISVLIGSNGCGKSTLLKSFARLLKPQQGSVILNGVDIQQKVHGGGGAGSWPSCLRHPRAPEGITVRQLVALGRYPYQSWMQQWSTEDEAMVNRALTQTSLQALADRPVDALSGGQRQRAWIAMTLAQDTGIVLLDEPTTLSTWRTRSKCWTCCATSTGSKTRPSSWCCTTSTWPVVTADYGCGAQPDGLCPGPARRGVDRTLVKTVFDPQLPDHCRPVLWYAAVHPVWSGIAAMSLARHFTAPQWSGVGRRLAGSRTATSATRCAR